MKFRPTESDTDLPAPEPPPDSDGPTDFASLEAGPGEQDGVQSVLARKSNEKKEEDPTDFQSLKEGWEEPVRLHQSRGLVDWLAEILAPVLIFVMVSSVLMFLLDVRYVYAVVQSNEYYFLSNANMRFVALCFILGVVALNRLIARDGREDSCLYVFGLGVAITLYTLAATGEVGSVADSFLDKPYVAVLFNLSVMAFLWWVTNRLTHECCVDENPLAGEVGFLTGTARRFREAMGKGSAWKWEPPKTTYDPVDPAQWTGEEPKKPVKRDETPTRRLPKRHPGISVLYFSVPVMLIFALGVRVVPHGGERMILMGYVYVVLYTLSALTLLMLTSLAQLRAYFRARRIAIPGALSVFWLGLGSFLVLVVLFGAAALPNPGLPSMAYIELRNVFAPEGPSGAMYGAGSQIPEEYRTQSQVIRIIGYVVLAGLGLFLAYAGIKALAAGAFALAREHQYLPVFLRRLLLWLDRLFQRFTNLPELPTLRRRRRVDRAVSIAAKYRNPLGDPARARALTPAGQVEYAYNALCALANDLGVPPSTDQTPYEFIRSFPKEMASLREEAEELTDLYVATAYAGRVPDEAVYDRLRKFWLTYERAKNRVVR